MRLVYLCYATLDAITPFPASLVALVGSIALFLFVLRFVVGGQEVTWLFLQVGRQWMLMVLVNHAHYVLSAGPVWAVVLLASALWTLQVIGYLLFIEGWFLLATEPFDLWTTSLLFLFLVTYSVLFCVKILIYCYPESAVAEFLMTDIRLDGQLAGRERPRPLTSEVLKTLLQGKVADLWTPRTRETEIIGKPCAVCCDDIEPEDTVIRLPCTGGHTFHKECVLEWFKRGNRGCPLCRMDVEEALKLEGSSRNPNVAVAAT
ncbi:unnamed protein product [Amoebophrya sp. A25]|nr:unnamed protein product [Amoebophrya sp. A25]|eukprot:GSA25T00023125001.1